MQPADVLSRYWGYDSFRECQAEIIDSVLAGRDTIGLLPTGGGKSITFQVPAMMLPGITVVITPLISLMKDQVDNLRERDICAVCIHSGMAGAERSVALERARQGMAKLVYISPERAVTEGFIAEMRSWSVSLLVVDEAHCISQWGYDFRPPYLKLAELRQTLPGVPALALTASATPEVVADIARRLEMNSPAIFSRSFSRENISYVVRDSAQYPYALHQALAHTSGSAIVYVRSREKTAKIAAELKAAGFSADFYHAGLEAHVKTERQEDWKSGKTRIIVATNAFGMGIDKPDVRLVVHLDVPPSLEEYYQEAGRAGRDGKESYALMIVNSAQKANLTRRFNDEFPGREYIRMVYDRACVFLNISIGSGYSQTYEFDPAKFCRTFVLQPRPALAALRTLTRAGVAEYHDDYDNRSRAMILVSKRELYDYTFTSTNEKVLLELLRNYTGLFADFVRFDEGALASYCRLPRQVVYEALLALSRMGVLYYIPPRALPYIYFPQRREESRHIVIPRTVYEDLYERAKRRMEAMRDYAFEHSTCRVQRMLRYFGQKDAMPCGKCDVCRAKRAAKSEDYDSLMLNLLRQHPEGVSLATLRHTFAGDVATQATESLRRMLDAGVAEPTPDGGVKLKT